MSNNRTVDDINVGIQIAAEAVQADHEERYGEAKRLYGKAVHLLLPFTRNVDIPAQQRADMGERIDQYRIRLRNLDRVVSEAAISPSRRSPSNFKVKYNPPKLSTPSTLRFNNFTVYIKFSYTIRLFIIGITFFKQLCFINHLSINSIY